MNQNAWVTRRENPAEERDRAHRIAIPEAWLATAGERVASRRIALVPAASSGRVDLTACCA